MLYRITHTLPLLTVASHHCNTPQVAHRWTMSGCSRTEAERRRVVPPGLGGRGGGIPGLNQLEEMQEFSRRNL